MSDKVSTITDYERYLREKIPAFRTKLSPPMTITKPSGPYYWQDKKLKDLAQVFYSGVRSSLHHHGDLAPYAGISGEDKLILVTPNAGKSQCGAFEYSLVVVNPRLFRDEIRRTLNDYCDALKANPKSEKAKYFRIRFEQDFGIKIPDLP